MHIEIPTVGPRFAREADGLQMVTCIGGSSFTTRLLHAFGGVACIERAQRSSIPLELGSGGWLSGSVPSVHMSG